ncbi:MAG: L,D-transpeptidase [Actinomycetota bacterium]|nr:L,D-transpeptidase [Actinomycetota bacterium]
MPARRRPAVVALVVALVVGSLAVIGLLQVRSSGLQRAALAGTADASPTTPSTTDAPPAVVDPVVNTTVAPPAPAPEPETVTVPGSTLRRGTAGAVSSPATIADVDVSRIGLYSMPGQAEPDDTFKNPTWEGLPLVFLVQQRQGDWLQVELNSRPNHTTAWIRAADVSLRTTTQRIVVSLADRSLTVYDGQTVVMQAPVAVGTSATPTPRGNFYIDGAVRTPDPGGVYGPYQLSVAAFSEVLMTFGSGIGQIAMHGTNEPSLIGSAVSNGCIRMNNADVTRLANTVAIGTPVQIS